MSDKNGRPTNASSIARTVLYVDPNGEVMAWYALVKYEGGGAQATSDGRYLLKVVI
jgi:hypothetical protein